MFSNREDNDSRFALGVAFTLIAIIVISLISTTVYKSRKHKSANTVTSMASMSEPALSLASEPAQAVASVASATEAVASQASQVASIPVISADSPSVVVINGVVKFYFATGSAQLATGAEQALEEVVKAVANGKKVTISGYHDSTGNPAANTKLAKQRANAVVAALVKLGVSKDKLETKKPESALADGPAAEARRVEVTVY